MSVHLSQIIYSSHTKKKCLRDFLRRKKLFFSAQQTFEQVKHAVVTWHHKNGLDFCEELVGRGVRVALHPGVPAAVAARGLEAVVHEGKEERQQKWGRWIVRYAAAELGGPYIGEALVRKSSGNCKETKGTIKTTMDGRTVAPSSL